ncbi:RICIN domain-containing protein [Actinoplanes sp. NPDC020271]|uniref:RICIN domain-containing protein n=1 Tax=Actinoplanes sp. NPDC020271 TaxID=3363896 RepID=UPI0037AC457A
MTSGALLTLAAALAAGGFVTRQAAGAPESHRGERLSAADVEIVVTASSSCPALTPARLAGQVMAASHFGDQPVGDLRSDGRTGIAALTAEQWQQNRPGSDADPADRAAAITALAHYTCRQIGAARALKSGEDPWRLAVAAYRVGMDRVAAAGRIPEDAGDYVKTVESYTAWYVTQPALARSDPAPAGPAAGAAVAVPDHDVAAVVAAGSICADVPPTRIAAQIMATSGFRADRLGPAGEQGIAYFLPQVWTTTVSGAAQKTPWDPAVAIPALGATMCKLVKDAGGYGAALTAFTHGTSATTATLLAAVTKAEPEYAKDTRLHGAATAPVATLKPIPPGSAAPAQNVEQPAVNGADGGSGGPYGPYFIQNLTTRDCVDRSEKDALVKGGGVSQSVCGKAGDPGQQWTFEARGTDSKTDAELYWIRDADDELCLDPPGATTYPSSSVLSETDCLDHDNQLFRLEKRLVADGRQYYWLRNTATGMCVDVPGAGTGGPGIRLTLVSCMTGDDHEWALTKNPES